MFHIFSILKSLKTQSPDQTGLFEQNRLGAEYSKKESKEIRSQVKQGNLSIFFKSTSLFFLAIAKKRSPYQELSNLVGYIWPRFVRSDIVRDSAIGQLRHLQFMLLRNISACRIFTLQYLTEVS